MSKHDASPTSGTATHSMPAKSGIAFQPIIGRLVAHVGKLFAPKMILPRLVARPRCGQRRPSTPLPLSLRHSMMPLLDRARFPPLRRYRKARRPATNLARNENGQVLAKRAVRKSDRSGA
jgi:hypothetical protein